MSDNDNKKKKDLPEIKGRLITISELAKEQGLNKRTLAYRLSKVNELYDGKLFIKSSDAKNATIYVREDILKLITEGVLEEDEEDLPVPKRIFDEAMSGIFEKLRQMTKKINAQGARIRELENKIKYFHSKNSD